ncbi:hypothetical protein MKX03_033529 [Papaver bracteatum]|nr:hypothetical protein MKX03_033529 [Papaver bracteatum]
MASRKFTFVAFLVMFIVFSTATRVANPACCKYYNIDKCEYSSYADNQKCNNTSFLPVHVVWYPLYR